MGQALHARPWAVVCLANHPSPALSPAALHSPRIVGIDRRRCPASAQGRLYPPSRDLSEIGNTDRVMLDAPLRPQLRYRKTHGKDGNLLNGQRICFVNLHQITSRLRHDHRRITAFIYPIAVAFPSVFFVKIHKPCAAQDVQFIFSVRSSHRPPMAGYNDGGCWSDGTPTEKERHSLPSGPGNHSTPGSD